MYPVESDAEVPSSKEHRRICGEAASDAVETNADVILSKVIQRFPLLCH